jgi:hypothetical protein
MIKIILEQFCSHWLEKGLPIGGRSVAVFVRFLGIANLDDICTGNHFQETEAIVYFGKDSRTTESGLSYPVNLSRLYSCAVIPRM